MHVYAYGCVSASMILLDTLRLCYSDFLSVHTCAYACVCIFCVHVCLYRCMFMCMYMYICMPVYMYAYKFIYARVWVYICTRVGTFCLFVMSNLSTTCACITGVSQCNLNLEIISPGSRTYSDWGLSDVWLLINICHIIHLSLFFAGLPNAVSLRSHYCAWGRAIPAPTNTIYHRASSEQRSRTRSCHE